MGVIITPETAESLGFPSMENLCFSIPCKTDANGDWFYAEDQKCDHIPEQIENNIQALIQEKEMIPKE